MIKAPKEEVEPDEEERQQKLAMMRKYYRNRHSTFIKTLLEQKKKKDEDREAQKQREEQKKQKVKDKVLAQMNVRQEVEPEAKQQPWSPDEREDRHLKRGGSMASGIKRQPSQRKSSLSARPERLALGKQKTQ